MYTLRGFYKFISIAKNENVIEGNDNKKQFDKNTEYFFRSSTKAESTPSLSVFTRTFRGTETSAQENFEQLPSHYDSRAVGQ